MLPSIFKSRMTCFPDLYPAFQSTIIFSMQPKPIDLHTNTRDAITVQFFDNINQTKHLNNIYHNILKISFVHCCLFVIFTEQSHYLILGYAIKLLVGSRRLKRKCGLNMRLWLCWLRNLRSSIECAYRSGY